MGGQPNPNQTVTNIQQTQLPQWYQDILAGTQGHKATDINPSTGAPYGTTVAGQTGLLPQAMSLAQSQYVPYTGQQVAGFTPAQQKAFDVVNQTGGNQTGLNWDAYYQNLAAAQSAQQAQADAAEALNSAQTYGGAAGQIAGGLGIQGSPTFQQGLGAAQQGLGYAGAAAQGAYGGAEAAQPFIQAASQPTGLLAAQPYLSAASATAPQNVGAYMNPYISSVNDALAQQYSKNLSQFILPQLQSQFVGLGQSGSPQQANFEANIINQQAQALGQQQAQNLQQGYGQALSGFESDAARQAQLAGTAGGLGTSQQQAQLQAGLGLGGLTQQGVGSLLGAGQTAGQLGLGTGQLGLGAGQLGTQGLLGAGQLGSQAALGAGGLNISAGGLQNQTATGLAGLGNLEQQQNLNYAAALNSIGTQQQQLGQTSLNTAYQNFLNQQQFPYQQLGYLSNIIHGLPVNQSSVYQTTGPGTTATMQPSILGQLGGAALGASGLAGSANAISPNAGVSTTYKKGGLVRGSRKNSSYGHANDNRGLGFAMAG